MLVKKRSEKILFQDVRRARRTIVEQGVDFRVGRAPPEGTVLAGPRRDFMVTGHAGAETSALRGRLLQNKIGSHHAWRRWDRGGTLAGCPALKLSQGGVP